MNHILSLRRGFAPTVTPAPIQQGWRPVGWLHGAVGLQFRQCCRSLSGWCPFDRRIRLQLHSSSWHHHGGHWHHLLHHLLPSIRATGIGVNVTIEKRHLTLTPLPHDYILLQLRHRRTSVRPPSPHHSRRELSPCSRRANHRL